MIRFGLQQKHIDLINGVLAKHTAIQAAFLYGYRAMGNYNPASDIDLTIIDTNLSFTEYLQIENELDDLLLPYKIDLSQKRQLHNPHLLEHINRVGIMFYKS